MAKKILYLEKRGCDFFVNDPIAKKSDCTNYRLVTGSYNINGKNDRIYFVELMTYTKYTVRKTNKRTGKPLKHPVRELVNDNALYIVLSFNENGYTYGDIRLENEIKDLNLSYTMQDILKAINYISKDQYTDIILK